MANFLFSAYFGGHFCYHSNSKSQSNLRLLHFDYCSNKTIKKKVVKNSFLYFSLIGGPKKALNARSYFLTWVYVVWKSGAAAHIILISMLISDGELLKKVRLYVQDIIIVAAHRVREEERIVAEIEEASKDIDEHDSDDTKDDIELQGMLVL